MSSEKEGYYDCSFVSIHYIICECGETFPSENGLRAHLEKEHPHKRERKEFKCGVCGLTFDTEDVCIQHYEENHIAEETLITEDQITYDDNIIEDKNIADGITCDSNITDDQIIDNNDISDDNYQDVKKEQLSDDEARADTFEVTTVTSEPKHDNLQDQKVEVQTLHLPEEYGQMVQVSGGQLVLLVSNPAKKKKEKEKNKEKKTPRKKNIRDRVCEVCGKKYSSNAALRYHQRVHTGERPYKCHLCPKTFTMPLFLQIHVRTHTGERPYACPLCPKAFSNKAALLRHDRVHTGEKPYACPMCYKTFTQSNSMKLHVTTVHLKQPAPYKSKSRKLKERQDRAKTKEYESITIKLDPNGYQSSSNDEEEGNYEVVESEEIIPDHEEECYEIVYDQEA